MTHIIQPLTAMPPRPPAAGPPCSLLCRGRQEGTAQPATWPFWTRSSMRPRVGSGSCDPQRPDWGGHLLRAISPVPSSNLDRQASRLPTQSQILNFIPLPGILQVLPVQYLLLPSKLLTSRGDLNVFVFVGDSFLPCLPPPPGLPRRHRAHAH